MQAAVLVSPGRMVLEDHPEPPEPGPNQALVAVRRVGICGTDHHAYRGTQNFFAYPRVLGHELAVEVLSVGAGVTNVTSGDLCAVLPYLSCGECRSCARGRRNCCERIDVLGVTVDGGLRDRMIVPAAHLFPGGGLTLDQLVLIETLGIGWHAVARAQPMIDDTVLILGAGPIGLAVAQSVRHLVAHLVVADLSEHRVQFARSLGLEATTIDSEVTNDLVSRQFGRLPTLVFDATGSRTSMEAAFTIVGATGTLVFVGHTTGDLSFKNPTFHARELDVRASRNATVADWADVMGAVGSADVDTRTWINHRTDLAGIVDQLPDLVADPGRIVKTVVDIGEQWEPS